VEVVEEPFEEADDDPNGHSASCVGVFYRFTFSTREFRACGYGGGSEAYFLGIAILPGGERQLFRTIPYDDAEFRAAAVYLRDSAGADTVSVLLPVGYVSVDFSRFSGLPPPTRPIGDMTRCLQCLARISDGQDTCTKCGWTWKETAEQQE
jgi:hypothetical protein